MVTTQSISGPFTIGDTAVLNFTLEANSSPIDLSSDGYTPQVLLLSQIGGAVLKTYTVEGEEVSITDGSAGQFSLTVPAADITALVSGSYAVSVWYAVQVVNTTVSPQTEVTVMHGTLAYGAM